MGILRPPGPKRIPIQEFKKVIGWALWTPYIVSVLGVLLFVLARIIIHFLRTNTVHLRRWSGIRDRLAAITSAGEFVDVYSQQSVDQTTPRPMQREQFNSVSAATIINVETQHSNLRESASTVTREKDLFVADRRIPPQAKGSWYNIYLLLLPLQVAIITIVIVHNIYNEEYHIESCDSFAEIANNFNESRFYDCRYHGVSRSNKEIFKICNTTNYDHDKISCSIYYYNPLLSSIILTILNSLLLHVTLAKAIVRFIIIVRYIVHKYGKTCRQKCLCNVHGAVVVSTVLVIVLGIVLLVYAVAADELVQSDLMTSMVLFTYVVVAASSVLFQCGLFQSDLYTSFSKCSFNVTDDPKPVEDTNTNIGSNEQTVDNDQTINSCFYCLHRETRLRSNYEPVE